VIPNSLDSGDRPVRLFPTDSPLRALVAPTFHTVRKRLDGLCISTIWIDADLDPTRAGFRPSYDGRHGPGASTMMPFVGAWMSTGPADGERGNEVLFPDTMDRTILEYAREIGLLGRHTFVSSLADIERTLLDRNTRLYSIDDLGEGFDGRCVVGAALSAWLNGKDDLASVTGFGPREVVKDMYAVTLDDYRAVAAPGRRVFLKTCNTETAGLGVHICVDEDDFRRHLDALRERQARYSLNRTLVVQRELTGRNRSFNLFLDPATPDEIQVIALTDQLVEADGKTYRGSVNHPINAANLERVGPVILDMVGRIWRRHPEAFGFLMCDFFESPEGEITVYDPGIRPSGNTATAMANLLAHGLSGRSLYTSNFELATGQPGLTFARLAAALGDLTRPETIAARGEAVLPWGWNAVQGRGILIGVAPDAEAFGRLTARVGALGAAADLPV
jgi:hypothetical protein